MKEKYALITSCDRYFRYIKFNFYRLMSPINFIKFILHHINITSNI